MCLYDPMRTLYLTIQQAFFQAYTQHSLGACVDVCAVGGVRYSCAISSIHDLLSAWNSMPYAQKASPAEYSRLILEGEAIINGERVSWQKTGVRSDSKQIQKESEKEQEKSEKVQKRSENATA